MMEAPVLVRIQRRCLVLVVGHGYADVTQLGVRGVDVDATKARFLHDTLVHSRLTHARLTHKMGANLVAYAENKLLGFFEGHLGFKIDFHLVFPFLVRNRGQSSVCLSHAPQNL